MWERPLTPSLECVQTPPTRDPMHPQITSIIAQQRIADATDRAHRVKPTRDERPARPSLPGRPFAPRGPRLRLLPRRSTT
jgi:hypothetical protein